MCDAYICVGQCLTDLMIQPIANIAVFAHTHSSPNSNQPYVRMNERVYDVHVCVCVCIYVVGVYVCMWMCLTVFMCIYVRMSNQVQRPNMRQYMPIYVCMCMCMRICGHVYVHAYVHMYVCTWTAQRCLVHPLGSPAAAAAAGKRGSVWEGRRRVDRAVGVCVGAFV